MANKEEIKDEQLDEIAGGNVGFTNPNNDNTGDFWVFYLDSDGKEIYSSPKYHCTDLKYVLTFRKNNQMFMTDLQILEKMQNEGYISKDPIA